jgi:anti-sigma B factor antagonist
MTLLSQQSPNCPGSSQFIIPFATVAVRKSPVSFLASREQRMSHSAAATLLTLDTERTGAVVIVRCHGKLVAGVGDVLYNEACRHLPGTKRMVLDLTDLIRMDSMGLGTLARLYVSSRSAGCKLELINIGKQVRELLGITNMFSVFADIGERGIKIP